MLPILIFLSDMKLQINRLFLQLQIRQNNLEIGIGREYFCLEVCTGLIRRIVMDKDYGKQEAAFAELLEIMETLRSRCPWDKKQTFDTLRTLTIEETFELSDAIVNKDYEDIKKEVGDVLLHVLFYAKIGEENGTYDIVDVINFFNGTCRLEPTVVNTREEFFKTVNNYDYDFSEVRGQENVKRAFEVACAGGHNIILVGSPGSGKSMMAKRLPSILPPLSLQEALETTKIHSVAGKLERGATLMTRRPFRAPHHTISPVALVGGGSYPVPGEISLAHNGILFLDELPEFGRQVLEVMRQPLEDRHITISRARYSVDYPASFMLVASMNPCPCGYYGHPTKPCVCPPGAVHKYLSKISGPLLDRIDIQIEVAPVQFDEMASPTPSESSEAIRRRVVKAREVQQMRFRNEPGVHCNAQMTSRLIRQYATPDSDGLAHLKEAMNRLSMSARAYDRILKVARTIADLAGDEQVRLVHLQEALSYRNLDRDNWGR